MPACQQQQLGLRGLLCPPSGLAKPVMALVLTTNAPCDAALYDVLLDSVKVEVLSKVAAAAQGNVRILRGVCLPRSGEVGSQYGVTVDTVGITDAALAQAVMETFNDISYIINSQDVGAALPNTVAAVAAATNSTALTIATASVVNDGTAAFIMPTTSPSPSPAGIDVSPSPSPSLAHPLAHPLAQRLLACCQALAQGERDAVHWQQSSPMRCSVQRRIHMHFH
ncbi:hypothetical protein COO60DRAFT_344015 [Scenedesmus sp. NREL 46B-D3]|nr:hypothetical protein COO60DRAFT_344015 [Scenedesmus sp. NREL 46B-D3]